MNSTQLLSAFVQHPLFPSRESVYVRWYPKTLQAFNECERGSLANAKPMGAYIHVPFCDRLCRFCPFNKRLTDEDLVNRFVVALKHEIEFWENRAAAPLKYVYFGGGTPSVLSPQQIGEIIQTLDRRLGVAPGAEITLETHPTHMTTPLLNSMKSAGVTRFSSGFQAFDDSTLARLGAQHNARDVELALQSADEAGVELAIDLLFRCPEQTLDDWGAQLGRAIAMGIPHISCYSLILKSTSRQPSAAEEAAMTVAMHDALSASGYEHYASCASGGFDYALPGHRCKYEVGHWGAPQDEFLGLGPGAFGFAAGRTTVNRLDIKAYCEKVSSGALATVSAVPASADELRRRHFVLGVKTLKVSLEAYRNQFGDDPARTFAAQFRELVAQGFASYDANWLELSQLGRFYVDTVSEMFFSDAESKVPHPEEPEIRRVELMTA